MYSTLRTMVCLYHLCSIHKAKRKRSSMGFKETPTTNELEIAKERKRNASDTSEDRSGQRHDDGREKPEASDLWGAVYDGFWC